MKCSNCNSSAVIYLAYSKLNLCKQHFFRLFEQRFKRTIREFSMIKKNDRVAVGLSGGKDSTVLLHILSKLREDLPFELIAITLDEGIAGYRNKTLDFAKLETKKLGVEHKIFRFKKEAGISMDEIMEKDKKEIPCSYCGVMRRYYLNKGAREAGADKLAVGHNLDDMAQTVLMNIMRNEPMRLARLADPLTEDDKFVPRIRPLMRTPEREIAIFAILNGIDIDFQECPYARHAFRAHIRDQLNESEEKYPGTKFKIVNSFMALQGIMRKSMEDTKFEISYCQKCKEPSSGDLCMFCTMMEDVQSK
ncbi:MAG: TIGR00269 family protein [Candidatus Micrarchaeota archaeon]|nr:TIGR00269 family protein [Candidatus Micrarchaeota archaeon]